jgi:aarF domain-containing kinase
VQPTTLRGFLRLLARALWLGSLLSLPLALGAACLLLPVSWRPYDAAESWLIWALRRGGVCSIKFGQWASTRPDLLPLSLCTALGQLHSQAPVHSVQETNRQILAAFGRTGYLTAVSAEPIGSGAIAQVHSAMGADGRLLAVKVMHPGVEYNVAADLWLIRAAAQMVQMCTPVRAAIWEGGGGRWRGEGGQGSSK